MSKSWNPIGIGTLVALLVACGERAPDEEGMADPASSLPDGGPGHAPRSDAAADGAPDARNFAPVALSITLHREHRKAAPYPIVVEIKARRAEAPAMGLAIEISAEGGVVSEVSERGGGVYTATVTPASDHATAIPITARTTDGASSARRMALSLPFVSDDWDQPESVPGMVNTPGTEDAATVSPDGEWLIVGTYSPVDILCCLLALPGVCPTATAASDPSSPPCDISLGPYAAPERPDLPGAERIVSPKRIRDDALRLGVVGQTTTAVPPAAAYGFRRQNDGSFAEPFVIAIEMDGYTFAPFAFSFVGTPVDGRAELVFAWDRVDDAPDTAGDIYWTKATLGHPVHLGAYEAGKLASFSASMLVGQSGNQHNPSFGLEQLWFDTEQGTDDSQFASADGPLPGAKLGPITNFPLNEPDKSALWPYADEEARRLYWGIEASLIASAGLIGADPGAAGSWSAPRVELAASGGTTLREIAAIGEPSIARVAGDGEWLYFAYYQISATGLDGEIGRVRRR